MAWNFFCPLGIPVGDQSEALVNFKAYWKRPRDVW